VTVELRGRTALVTGAGRRVGRVIAVALARRGMHVGVHYHGSTGDAEETVRLCKVAGGDGWAVRGDLRHVADAERVVQDTALHFGQLDALVNSAAIMMRTPLSEVTVEAWDEMMSINLRAPFFCARAAAVVMGERGGAIVNIADLAGMEAWPAYIPHGISKAGVIQMTKALAHTLAPKVRVNAVAPGAVLLPEGWRADDAKHLEKSTPLGRIGTPEDVAQAVIYLLEADYVTGDVLIVDGGRHVR
jgi:pteridine reductase